MLEPMTLGNMRANGIHTLAVRCLVFDYCHETVLEVDSYGKDIPVPAFEPCVVCTACGAIGADVRPN